MRIEFLKLKSNDLIIHLIFLERKNVGTILGDPSSSCGPLHERSLPRTCPPGGCFRPAPNLAAPAFHRHDCTPPHDGIASIILAALTGMHALCMAFKPNCCCYGVPSTPLRRYDLWQVPPPSYLTGVAVCLADERLVPTFRRHPLSPGCLPVLMTFSSV